MPVVRIYISDSINNYDETFPSVNMLQEWHDEIQDLYFFCGEIVREAIGKVVQLWQQRHNEVSTRGHQPNDFFVHNYNSVR